VLSLKHSLHRKPSDAPGFYAMYCGLIVLAAALVLLPGVPLGLLTNAVQTLAGVLLPSATVFLLLLCNDKAVLGPWVNSRLTNIATGAIVAVLVLLSIILTASVVFPDMSGETIVGILIGGGVISLIVAIAINVLQARAALDKAATAKPAKPDLQRMYNWRMPALTELKPMILSQRHKWWMGVLRGYLVVAMGMVIYKVVALAIG
jgi:protein-S-isoprenylcysteine O-methyltransferase Ste14